MSDIDYKNWPEEKKWWKKDSDIPEELNDVPIITNKSGTIKNSEWCELHHRMAQMVIDFFKEHSLPPDAYMVDFSFDDIKSSAEHGSWHPYSDSGLGLATKERDYIIESC